MYNNNEDEMNLSIFAANTYKSSQKSYSLNLITIYFFALTMEYNRRNEKRKEKIKKESERKNNLNTTTRHECDIHLHAQTLVDYMHENVWRNAALKVQKNRRVRTNDEDDYGGEQTDEYIIKSIFVFGYAIMLKCI